MVSPEVKFYLLAIAAVLAYLVWEKFRHKATLDKLRIRVHVNGTRGKSSVTRLIAAGLRAGGIRTCAKTTGTLPRFIFPDGKEAPVYRPLKAQILEQVRIVRTAVACDAEALVMECMALQPKLQSLSELSIMQSTHSVITNVRPDHLDVMGPAEADVALALLGTTPKSGKLFTNDIKYAAQFAKACEDRDSALHIVSQEELAEVTNEDLSGFSYFEHRDNVALALKVCRSLGISKEVALAGMHSSQPDPGVMRIHELERSTQPKSIMFVNGFAANDPQSSSYIHSLSIDRCPHSDFRAVIINCRQDRAERSLQLADLALEPSFSKTHFILVGTGTHICANRLSENRVEASRIMDFKSDTHEMLRSVEALCHKHILLVGLGNILGPGLLIEEYFAKAVRDVRVNEGMVIGVQLVEALPSTLIPQVPSLTVVVPSALSNNHIGDVRS